MAIQAGWLNRTIAVYAPGVLLDNGLTKVAGTSGLLGEFRAAMEPVSDAERARAAETRATVTLRFLVRWCADTTALIDETYSVVYEGRTYGIAHAKEATRWRGADGTMVPLRPREGIEISATARAETPA